MAKINFLWFPNKKKETKPKLNVFKKDKSVKTKIFGEKK